VIPFPLHFASVKQTQCGKMAAPVLHGLGRIEV
jgi:hypothetical protein